MRLIIHTDGGSRGNPGPAAAGLVIADESGKNLLARGVFLGKQTNNVAEYLGIVLALEEAAALGGTEIYLYCDSQLLVRQINGEYKVKNANLKTYYQKVVDLINHFDRVSVHHVYREDNKHADAMVNKALDAEKDVVDIAKPTANVAFDVIEPEPPNPAVRATVNLREKIAFGAEPRIVSLSENGIYACELVCLDTGQQMVFRPRWQQATLTVMRGEGEIQVNSRKQAVAPGTFMHVGETESVKLTAKATETLVVIINRLMKK